MSQMIEDEMEAKAIKMQSAARGMLGRRKAANKMQEQMEGEMETAAVSVQAVFRGHQARKEAYTVMSADMEKRMNETAERIGTYDKSAATGAGGKRNDLVSHVLRLQERVKEIQHIVKAVVPVFNGEEPDNIPPGPGSSTTGNGKTPKDITVTVIGLDGVGAAAAQLFARVGVAKLRLVDEGSVDAWHVQNSGLFSASHSGKKRAEIAKQILDGFGQGTDVECAVARDEASLGSLVEGSDLVLDCTPASREAIRAVCSGKCTRVQCGVQGLSAHYQIFSPTDNSEDKYPTIDANAGPPSGTGWLIPSTIHACAGHLVQNALKASVGMAGVVTALWLDGQ